MKTALILLGLATTANAYSKKLHWNYNGDADPCHVYKDKRACGGHCVWTQKPRDMHLGKADRINYGRHTAPDSLNKGSCASLHLIDRIETINYGADDKWGSFDCSDAYWLKDCKDLNQHYRNKGSSGNKCEWTCDQGCIDASGDAVSDPSPYQNCAPCTPEEESPSNRVLCNKQCDVCLISANRDKYKNKGIIGGLLVMKARKGDPWMTAYRKENDDSADTDDEIKMLDGAREYFMGDDAWGILNGDTDAGDDETDYSFFETACRTLGYGYNGQYHYQDTDFDEDTNMSSYEGGAAWRLAGLHTGYLDETHPDHPEGYDGDYIGGHDYMDYLDYTTAERDFPWLKIHLDSNLETIYISGIPYCPGSPEHLHDCNWDEVTAESTAEFFDYHHYATGLVCCKKEKDCAMDEDLEALFTNQVFQPWNL